jgi:GAF domain-containing protein
MDTSNVGRLRKAVLNVADSILEKKRFSDAARAIFEYCKDLTGATSGYVALLNESGNENEALFLETGGIPCNLDPGLPMPLQGLRKSACQLKKAVYENDFMNSEWAAFMPEGHMELRNVMFAPLNVGSEVIGILGLANKPGDFSKEDTELAEVFGELAALALQNSRLIERLNNITESLFIPLG